MRLNIDLDSALVNDAFKVARVKTIKGLVDLALREFVRRHRRADVRVLRGKGLIDPAYDYRAAR
jgi:Arc/MetJ family transcription regulator